jgi:hypothetical protein
MLKGIRDAGYRSFTVLCIFGANLLAPLYLLVIVALPSFLKISHCSKHEGMVSCRVMLQSLLLHSYVNYYALRRIRRPVPFGSHVSGIDRQRLSHLKITPIFEV